MSDKFPTRLRMVREATGKTQARVAEEIGVTLNIYSHYERNNKRPAIKTFAALCVALGTPGEQLLNDQPPSRLLSSEQIMKLKAMDSRQLILILNLLQTIYDSQRK